MKKYFPFCITALLFFGCVKENHFGKSAFKQIRYFQMQNQSGTAQIIEDSLLIRVTVAADAEITNLRPDSVLLSTYARLEPGKEQYLDFTTPQQYTVLAEDGSDVKYTVIVTQEGSTPQLENSGFDEWYTPAGKNYEEPGLNANTIWATGNAGVVTINSANVTGVVINGTDKAAQLVTKDLGALGQLVGQRMGAGTIFTGKFELDIANPLNSAKFGIAYSAKPKSVTLTYTYVPGTPYRNGKGSILTKQDSCDIYLLLENRTGDTKRVATGWFRSNETVSTPKQLTIPIIYGTLPGAAPAYSKPANGLYGNASDKVTHLSFVAASSASGALFEGGVNSTLVINNLQLNY